MLKENLAKYRKLNGWTQQDLAQRSGFSRSSIINWETGKREPKFIDIKTLANVVGISPNELLDTPQNTYIDNITQSFNTKQEKKINEHPSMSYWGEVIDNIHKVLEDKNIYEISMIESLLRSGCKLLSIGKQQIIQVQSMNGEKTAVEQHIEVHDNTMETGDININAISTEKHKNAEVS